MTPNQEAALSAMLVAVPITIGIYLFGRIRQGDLRAGRDGLTCAAFVGLGILFVLSAREPAIPAVALPALIAGIGVFVLRSNRNFFQPFSQRTVGLLMVFSGLLGSFLGLIRSALGGG
jgi:hypothetical protein